VVKNKVEVVAFSRVRPDFKKLLGRVTDKPVLIQAPDRYQNLVGQFTQGLLPWEEFLTELSKRTGSERPEEELFWPRIVRKCSERNLSVKLIEPDIDKLLGAAQKKLQIKGDKSRHIMQESRLWFISGAGYINHFFSAFDAMFFWLPFKTVFRRIWLKFWSFIVNIIPGDQKDVMAAVNFAYDSMTKKLVKMLAKVRVSTVFLDEIIASRVERMVSEL